MAKKHRRNRCTKAGAERWYKEGKIRKKEISQVYRLSAIKHQSMTKKGWATSGKDQGRSTVTGHTEREKDRQAMPAESRLILEKSNQREGPGIKKNAQRLQERGGENEMIPFKKSS